MSQIALHGADIRLRRMSPEDVRSVTPELKTLRALALQCQPMYPGIAHWFDRKVAGGILTGERSAFVAFLDDQPIATAVIKIVRNAKFCHLRIVDGLQDAGLGALFFSLMALESRRAETIRFTLPESLWHRRREFFRSFGFAEAVAAGTQYRLFDRELRCGARFQDVWDSALARLTSLAKRFTIGTRAIVPELLCSIKADYANAIMRGEKRVEVRRRFNPAWVGSRMALYATAPTQAVVGTVRIHRVVAAHPQTLWRDFGPLIGCTESEFWSYAEGSKELSAVVVDDVRSFRGVVPKAQLEFLTRMELRPPQSICSSKGDPKWARALCVAALLQATAIGHTPDRPADLDPDCGDPRDLNAPVGP